MKKISREEHVADEVEMERRLKANLEIWTDDAKIDLFGKEYKLHVFVTGNTLEEHRVMKGQFCVNDWLSDEEKFEVIRYLGELWPEVEMP